MKPFKILLLFFSLLLFSCGNDKNVKEETIAKKDSLENIMPPPLNPNGESELALLMRDMVKTTQQIQDALQNKTELPSYPEGFGRIYFAKKTDSTLNKELFNGLADNYLRSLKFFYDSPAKEKIHTYNGMVNSCIGCHQNFCGGPIKRIRKFILPE